MRTKVGGRRSEDGGQKSEVRGQKSEDGKTEIRNRERTEGGVE